VDESLEKAAVSAATRTALSHAARGVSSVRAKLQRLLKKGRTPRPLGTPKRRADGVGLKVPKRFASGISEKDKEKAYRGYRAQAMRSGEDSLVGYFPKMLAEKLLGKKRVGKALWKGIHEPALRADTAIGDVLAKMPGVGGLFKSKEQIPWGKGLHKDVTRSSALGPLTKLRDVAEPIALGVGLERGIHKVKEITGRNHENSMDDFELRKEAASTMLRLHQENKEHTKRAHALRLLYKQAELGQSVLPQTLSELEEKLASLVNQDLVVFEKALELAGGSMKLGELSRDEARPFSAEEQFRASVLSD
jgi:hypothetical protein